MTLPTQTADLQAAIKKTLHSAAFARFMGQAVHSALAEVQPAASTTLAPIDGLHSEFCCGGTVIRTSDAGHNTVFWTQRREDGTHPGGWFGSEKRRDQNGRVWERSYNCVTDDFGNLVDVTA